MQKDNSKIVLIGGGGHCKSCIEVIEQEGVFEIAGILEQAEKRNETVLGYPVIGNDEDIKFMAARYKNLFITLGHMKLPDRRTALFEKAKYAGGHLPVIVSPRASVSRYAELAEGTIVMDHAVVRADTRVGQNSIVNTAAIIEHDVRVGDHCHVSTGCIINGGCRIGRQVFLGSGCVLKESVRVCDCVILGAGAVVTKDLDEPGTYMGVPARKTGKDECVLSGIGREISPDRTDLF